MDRIEGLWGQEELSGVWRGGERGGGGEEAKGCGLGGVRGGRSQDFDWSLLLAGSIGSGNTKVNDRRDLIWLRKRAKRVRCLIHAKSRHTMLPGGGITGHHVTARIPGTDRTVPSECGLNLGLFQSVGIGTVRSGDYSPIILFDGRFWDLMLVVVQG